MVGESAGAAGPLLLCALDHVEIEHFAADDIAHERDRVNGISGLILAGQLLTEEVIERF